MCHGRVTRKTSFILVAWCALAAAVSAADPEATQGPALSLAEMVKTGGWLMFILGAMSVAGLALAVYFLLLLRLKHIAPPDFLHDIRDMLAADRIDEARRAARKSNTAIAAILLAALEHLRHDPRPEPAQLRDIVEGEGSRQATLLQNQTQYLLDIAVIAPMVGLLGTVMGMLRAFNAVALDIAKARPMVLADGVSQALITTATGLMVGIPAMIFYAYFRGRTTKLIARLEVTASDLLPLLSSAKETS